MRGPICKVCSSAARKTIDADIVGGVMSLREVSTKYGITKSTLHNHKIRCMRVVPSPNKGQPDPAAKRVKAKEAREAIAVPSRIAFLESCLPTREELSLKLEHCIEKLEAIVERNSGDDGVDVVAISGLSGIRQTVADLAKIAGHVGGAAQVQTNVQVNVAVSACDIANSLAGLLASQQVPPIDLLELSADE